MTSKETFEQRFWLLVHALDGFGANALGIPSELIDEAVGIALGKVPPTEADLEQFHAWYSPHPSVDPALADLNPLEDWRLSSLSNLGVWARHAAIYYNPEVVRLAEDLEKASDLVGTERLDRWEALCSQHGIVLYPFQAS